jgi:pyridoxine 5-phosphate synthase
MTALSVNVNKLALLRNSRGRNFPDVQAFAQRFLDLGVHGITVHPRPDQRHVRFADVPLLAEIVRKRAGAEFNVEGFPSLDFVALMERVRPHQCTLVPDAADQLTSDHGWDLVKHGAFLTDVVAELQRLGIRVSLFLDPLPEQVARAAGVGAERIELYTEAYAAAFTTDRRSVVLSQYRAAANEARQLGLAVNAGHDLDLQNLPLFLGIGGVREVSIGHALTIECIEYGMQTVIARYLAICRDGASVPVR